MWLIVAAAGSSSQLLVAQDAAQRERL